MPTRNVVLTEPLAAMVTRLVDTGQYQNASEVIREGLRLIERREREERIRLEALREAVCTGIADIEAKRFEEFGSLESLGDLLSILADEALSKSN